MQFNYHYFKPFKFVTAVRHKSQMNTWFQNF